MGWFKRKATKPTVHGPMPRQEIQRLLELRDRLEFELPLAIINSSAQEVQAIEDQLVNINDQLASRSLWLRGHRYAR